ncbi:MAG: hypothetical protein Q7S19_02540 [bacterium]|nr:hypothetical protein [bacterium]
MNSSNPEGVQVSVQIANSRASKKLTPAKDGLLGRYNVSKANLLNDNYRQVDLAFTLNIDINDKEKDNVFGFMIDRQGNLNKKKNEYYKPDPALCNEENLRKARNREMGDHKTYSLRIQLYLNNEANCLYIKYPENTLRLLKVNRETLVIEQWEISVTDQNGYFFLNQQCVYRWQILCNDESITSRAKELANWPAMTRLIEKVLGLGQWMANQTLITENTERPVEPEVLDFGPDTGTTEWFNEARGFGKIKTNQGLIVNAHWSKIILAGNRSKRFLETGSLVRIKGLELHETRSSNHLQAVGINQVS